MGDEWVSMPMGEITDLPAELASNLENALGPDWRLRSFDDVVALVASGESERFRLLVLLEELRIDRTWKTMPAWATLADVTDLLYPAGASSIELEALRSVRERITDVLGR